jgi:hypothetical protein
MAESDNKSASTKVPSSLSLSAYPPSLSSSFEQQKVNGKDDPVNLSSTRLIAIYSQFPFF